LNSKEISKFREFQKSIIDLTMSDTHKKSPLTVILDAYRVASVTEREKGTYFEELIVCYLRNEATYKDLYSDVWTYSQWAELQGLPKNDAGIDLVAKTADTGEFHAIQCKLYAPTYRDQQYFDPAHPTIELALNAADVAKRSRPSVNS